jgi:protein TonB
MKRTMLGLEAGAEEEPAPEREPSPGGSLLGLRGAASAPMRATASRPDPAPAGIEDEPDEELFHLDRGPQRAFPIERAILFSLAAHVLFLLLVVSSPRWMTPTQLSQARKGILGAFIPEEPDRIPVVFRAAPGPARDNPKPSAPSNLTRRAGGGDPARPKADTPFIPNRPGIEGLAEGSPGARPRAPAARSAETAPSTGAPRPQTPPGAAAEKQAGGPDAFRVPAPGSGQSGREETRLAGLDRAIQEAAKDEVQRRGSGGQNGAGFPNPDGGFTDAGGVSFDTSWYDWGDYADAMVRRIKLHWHAPMDLMYLGAKGKVTIRFFIMADGTVSGVQLLRPSDHPPYTSAAMQAILTSNPFRPLPKDLLRQVPGKDREGVVVTFFYNLRPGKDGEESAK